jgi:hypothetical protein
MLDRYGSHVNCKVALPWYCQSDGLGRIMELYGRVNWHRSDPTVELYTNLMLNKLTIWNGLLWSALGVCDAWISNLPSQY